MINMEWWEMIKIIIKNIMFLFVIFLGACGSEEEIGTNTQNTVNISTSGGVINGRAVIDADIDNALTSVFIHANTLNQEGIVFQTKN